MAIQDIMIDAKRLRDEILPSAWGQTFVDGPGRGISLDKVLGCIQRAKRETPEGYIKESPVQLLYQLVTMSGKRPAFTSEAKIRQTLSGVRDENMRNFSGGEKALFGALRGIADPRYRLRFYLSFWEELDPLIEEATRPPRPKMILVED